MMLGHWKSLEYTIYSDGHSERSSYKGKDMMYSVALYLH